MINSTCSRRSVSHVSSFRGSETFHRNDQPSRHPRVLEGKRSFSEGIKDDRFAGENSLSPVSEI